MKLPSGAELHITLSPFEDSLALYQSILEEMKLVKIVTGDEVGDLIKNLFCVGFSSKKVQAALWKCMERVTYDNGKGKLKVTKDTFEPEEARVDYMQVCIEVAKANVMPFTKNLYALYTESLNLLQKDPA